MILNAKNNNFRFEFPKEFFFPEVIKKYEYIIKKLPCPYKTIKDYINLSIQEVTFPSVSLNVTEQESLHNPKIPWKGKGNLELNMDKNISVTFKLYEGYINYWIMFEQLKHFIEYDSNVVDFPDLYLTFMDNIGYELFTFKLGRVIYTKISELSLSFSSNIPTITTFSCDFTFTNFEFLKRLD